MPRRALIGTNKDVEPELSNLSCHSEPKIIFFRTPEQLLLHRINHPF
jgi:hypothetical protein